MTCIKLYPCATRLGNLMFQYAVAKCVAPNEPATFFSWCGMFLGTGKTIFFSILFGSSIQGENRQGLYFDGSEVIKNDYSLGMWLKAMACMVKKASGDLFRQLGLR